MAGDPNFTSVVLLCHFDGTNGQATTTDSSPSAHSVLIQGTQSSLSTAQKKFGTASLITNAGGLGYASTSSGLTDFQFGSGQFTVEAWVYLTSYSGASTYVVVGNYQANSNLGWDFVLNSGVLNFNYSINGTTSTSVGAAWTPTLNTWYHVAADRDSSNVVRVYLNGAVHASATVASTLFASTRNLYIGNDGNSLRGWPGHIDDVRVTKGVARYGGAFTPPTTAFPDSFAGTRRRPVVAICG